MKTFIPLLFIFIIAFQQPAKCQKTDLDAHKWAKILAGTSDKSDDAFYKLGIKLGLTDTAITFRFLEQVRQDPFAKGNYFMARFNCLKAGLILLYNLPGPASSSTQKEAIEKKVTEIYEKAIRYAFITDDDYLIAFISGSCGTAMSVFKNTGKAIMYLMYSAELFEKLQYKGEYATTVYGLLGEMLWRIREYQKSIHYSKLSLEVMPDYQFTKDNTMRCYNTIALGYHRLGQYDSAMLYYNKGLQEASELGDKQRGIGWNGIISGNIAQIDFAQKKYHLALSLFEKGYKSSKKNEYYDDAANSLQWAARTNLELGNKSEALSQVREAFQLLKKLPKAANYRQYALLTASEIFKSLGNNDSALFYTDKYNLLHDSLERDIYESSTDIAQLRLDNEKNRYNIQKLEWDKKTELETRNYIIAGILLFCALVLLLINRQRQKAKNKARLERQEKAKAELETESSRAQLKMFTKSIVEKTSLIEKLERQVKNNLKTDEQHELIEELCRQTILTEDDWLNFKTLFEKMYPLFFEKMIRQVNGITHAEQRMSALTLLHLTTKQMAAVLGISPNSVIKARQRLRQRLKFESDMEVEDFITNL